MKKIINQYVANVKFSHPSSESETNLCVVYETEEGKLYVEVNSVLKEVGTRYINIVE